MRKERKMDLPILPTKEADLARETEKGLKVQPQDQTHHNKGDPDLTCRKNPAIAAATAPAATRKWV